MAIIRKERLALPYVQRGIVYGAGLLISGVGGYFGWINAEQADSVTDALPGVLAWLTAMGTNLLALMNLNRGSDSSATDADVEDAYTDGLSKYDAEKMLDLLMGGMASGNSSKGETDEPGGQAAEYPSSIGHPGTYPG